MEFFGFSLPDAIGIYMGLAVQSIIRNSPLKLLVPLFVAYWFTALLTRQGMSRDDDMTRSTGPMAYLARCVIICALFWPEALLLERTVYVTTAAQVRSEVAARDPDATMVSAEDTGQVPQALNHAAMVTPGFGLIYKMLADYPLGLARQLSDRTQNVFNGLMPIQWLLGTSMTADISKDVQDWTHNCYVPVQTTDAGLRAARTVEDFLPWGDTPMARALHQREVQPGSQVGITWIRSNSSAPVRMACDDYLLSMEGRVQTLLTTETTANGTPKSEVFQQATGMEVDHQARFLIYMEILRAAEGAVPPPSLAGQYAALRAYGVGGQAVAGGAGATASGIPGMAAGNGFPGFGVLVGILRGGITGTAGEFQRLVDAASWCVGLALMLTWYGPTVAGYLTMTIIGLQPFMLLWLLIPNAQLQPLLAYFVTLLYLMCLPIIWALVDQLSTIQQMNLSQFGSGYDAAVMGFLTNSVRMAMYTSLGIFAVGAATGAVLFVNYRYVSSMWRSAV